ncbi:ABC transporter ATP-binding protein [Gordonia neofelifaecis]|uniref:Transmembrane ATP-binding protein ABC transporter n=1 Tax=Gordonia neofelifaecis NRRL B-59395 TaxID=644548 RepID=F1YPB8_9ACTN|nr:ABC transporter ATP-binding protein [Gordonia neofelifaecis]EGD53438.1 transmembrane ATP-binding protein ABC transporter [Gordonia neofelifaecis NRRL B-59395]
MSTASTTGTDTARVFPTIFADVRAITGDDGRPHRVAFYTLTAVSTALQAAAVLLLIPLLRALFGESPSDAWIWVAVMAVVLAAGWTADILATRAGLRMGFGLVDAAERAGIAAIRRLDTADLHGDRASRLRSLVTKSGPESTSAVVLLFSPLIHAALLIPMLAVGLLFVSWPLALVALVGGVVLLGAFYVGRRSVAKSEEGFTEAGRALDDRMFEFGWAQPTLRAAGVGSTTVDAVVTESRRRGLRLLAWQIPGDLLFTVTGQLVLLAFGVTTGALYLDGDLSGVTAAAMIVVLLRVVETTGSLSLLATPIAGVERLLGELRELVAEEADAGETATVVPGTGVPTSIQLSSVGYTYPDGTRALNEVDLDVRPGEITVLVGASGSGKSTLLDVLAGLREPTAGAVLVDGAPATSARRLGESAVVFQSTSLKPGTLLENVATGTTPELAEIADLAQLDAVPESLPDGWDSRIGDGGNTLSGGERQRVGLARALAKRAGVLLVDEATSSLDVITERAVVDSLRRIRGTRTVVAVTHRPALVALADSVVVLDEGRVVDSGAVDELLARGGVFADLWTRWRESEGWQV